MLDIPPQIIEAHAYDFVVKDKHTDDDNLAIHCWALDRDSKPLLLRFVDFPAFCHIELPKFVYGRRYKWNRSSAMELKDLIAKRLGDDAPLSCTYKEVKKTYYYLGPRKHPMIQLTFKNLEAMRHCSNLLKDTIMTDKWGCIKCNVWEDRICPIRKLLTIKNVKYSEWFRVNATPVPVEDRISTIENEYYGNWRSMVSVPHEECSTWESRPSVLAFDIECYSDNHRAMPDKYNHKHDAYMISCIYTVYKATQTRKRYCVIIGDCNQIPPDKLENCEIIKVNSELEMIDAFAHIVNTTDPDVLTGYNILGFDYPYLDHRIKRQLEEWPAMGRIEGEKSTLTSKTWKSGAYGHQSINILHMEGRISIDLLPIVKRDYKLEKYDLNTVCKKFLGKGKHDVTAPEMFKIYEDMRNTLTVVVGIMREAQDNPKLLHDDDYRRRLTYAQDAFDQAKEETAKVMEYCIQDSELTLDLMEVINVWVGLREMSNIVGVSIVQLFTQGQQVRCVSQLYDLAARLGYVLDTRDTPGFKFNGGYVQEPIPGLYDNIICLDFASLYPSIIMAYNICYTTLVHPDMYDSVKDEDCNIIEFDQEEELFPTGNEEDEEEDVLVEVSNGRKKKPKKTVIRHYKFKFLKKHVQEGLLPRLVNELVTQRRAVNKEVAVHKQVLKALVGTEDIRNLLEKYLDGSMQLLDPVYAKDHVTNISTSTPPAAPEVISAAKKDQALAELLCLDIMQSELNKAQEHIPPLHPDLVKLAEFRLGIAKIAGDKIALQQCLDGLNFTKDQRCNSIDTLKVVIEVKEKRGLALKVSANSFFGFLGVHTGGKMPLIEGAMSITAKGRELIGIVSKYIETKYGGIQVYGDTDTLRGHSPLLVRYETGAIDFVQIEDLVMLPPGNGEKQIFTTEHLNLEVWSDEGWTKIKYIMRHKTTKQLYRVVTHTGVVDATEDHSLLDSDGYPVTPNEISVGMHLLHKDLPKFEHDSPYMTPDKAWAWGFFMAEGTCGKYTSCPTRPIAYSWSVSNQNHDFLNKAQRIFNEIERNNTFVIDPCMVSSNVDKLNARGDVKALALKYDQLFYTKRSDTVKQHCATDLGIRYKKVPNYILSGTKEIKEAFLQGWYDGDGAKTGVNKKFDIKGQIGAAGLYYIATSVGWKVSINSRNDKDDIYSLIMSKSKQRKHTDVIKKITPLGIKPDEYVYDIETENHHFSAGVGRMVVHNSVMMDLKIKDPVECNKFGIRLAQEISGIKPGEKDIDDVYYPEGRPGLFPPPLAMEFEKAMRMLCLCKKKYAAYLIGKDGNFKREDILDRLGNVIGDRLVLLKRGIILARRDNPYFLRKTYTKILDNIMDRLDLDRAMDILIDAIQDLFEGRVPYEDLVIVRGLGANYKSDSYFMKVFSDELKKAGKIVNPGDRLDFLIIENPNATLLGQKMVLTEQYVESLKTDNPYVIDYNYYVEKVLMNSINQLFAVGFKDTIPKMKVSYRPTNRHKTIYMDKPVKIILMMKKRGYNLDEFKEAVRYNVGRTKNHTKLRLNVIREPADVPLQRVPFVGRVNTSPNSSPPLATLS